MKRTSVSYISMFVVIIVATLALIVLELNNLTSNYITQVTLGLLIALSFFFVEKNQNLTSKINNIENEVENIKSKVINSVTAEVLTGSEQAFLHLNNLINKNSDVVATNLSERNLATDILGKEVQRYVKTLDVFLSNEDTKFKLRRLVDIKSNEKLQWAKDTITRNKKSSKYFMSIRSKSDFTPLPNIIIVDKKHTLVFGEHFSSIEAKYLYFESHVIAEYFLALFDQAWKNSIVIKEGKKIDFDALASIENNLSETNYTVSD